MKPTDILTISEPVEQMYMDCQSQLIINICKHFKGDDLTPTAQWEFQKLSELDAVTQESIEIIAANTGKAPEVIEKAITEGLKLETIPTEKVLSAAANKGVIKAPMSTWNSSLGIQQAVKSLTEQAVNDSNIVNTVMLNSTRERYINAVQNAAADEVKLIEQLQSAKGLSALNQQLAVTQTALNTATTSVVTGVEARTTAVRRVISELAEQGITGFVDRAGHHWSPEAYINMDIRTTVHNAAVQGQKARSADYGVTTFQISSHSGARPLCAPYQGKFYSWDNTSGVVEDLHGRKYSYKPINSTSYGEPAGIFGINCGHFPLTFVDGFSVPRYEPDDSAENAKQYQLSQRQRYMERNIRKSKTEALAYNAAGDKEAFQQTAVKIAQQNTQYKLFCEANGLTERLERTQVIAYNRSISSKVAAAVKRNEATSLHSKYADYLGTSTPEATAIKVQSIKAEGHDWLLDGYVKAVRKGDINALVGIDTYIDVAKDIEHELIGITAANGVEVKGYTTHFVDRIIGQVAEPHEGKRQAVTVAEAKNTLLNGELKPVKTRQNGLRSQRIAGNNSFITINPDTGILLQANPRGKKK